MKELGSGTLVVVTIPDSVKGTAQASGVPCDPAVGFTPIAATYDPIGRLPVKSRRSFGAKVVVPINQVVTSYPVMESPNSGAPPFCKLVLTQPLPPVVPMSHATIFPNWKELLAKGPRPIKPYRSPEDIVPQSCWPPTETVEVVPPG